MIVRAFNQMGLKCHLPRGSFYAFPCIESTGLSSKEFALIESYANLVKKWRAADLAPLVADRFAKIDCTMQGSYKQLVDPLAAFDAVVHIDKVTPWHTFIGPEKMS